MTGPSRRRSTAAALALLAAGAACPAEALGSGRGPARITIAFTGDVSGYLEPCG